MAEAKKYEFKPMYSDVAELGRVLSHPARIMILDILAKENRCVTDLVTKIPLSQSTISQHLKVLKDSNLIDFEVESNRNAYCLNKKKLSQLSKLLEKTLTAVLA